MVVRRSRGMFRTSASLAFALLVRWTHSCDPEDCMAEHCSTSCCFPSERDVDWYCPNCHGADFECMAGRDQSALGKSPAFAGTYNNFASPGQTGFCQYQSPAAPSTKSEGIGYGPQMLYTNRVIFGVGLAQAQFIMDQGDEDAPSDGAVACGMCLEVEAKMSTWDCELTEPDSRCVPTTGGGDGCENDWHTHKVVMVVVDQCKDGWDKWSQRTGAPGGNCVTGHLDLDVYPPDGDLSFLDIKEMTWRAVDCPVDGLPIQYAFSTDTSNAYYFAFQIWDMRTPVKRVQVKEEGGFSGTGFEWVDLEFKAQGWTYTPKEAGALYNWPTPEVRLTSVYGEVLEDVITVPVAHWKQVEGWLAMPPAVGTKNFAYDKNPPSAEANADYKHCLRDPYNNTTPAPTVTYAPSASPGPSATYRPSATVEPTATPQPQPAPTPAPTDSHMPTRQPTHEPTVEPTPLPTAAPTHAPITPTPMPSQPRPVAAGAGMPGAATMGILVTGSVGLVVLAVAFFLPRSKGGFGILDGPAGSAPGSAAPGPRGGALAGSKEAELSAGSGRSGGRARGESRGNKSPSRRGSRSLKSKERLAGSLGGKPAIHKSETTDYV